MCAVPFRLCYSQNKLGQNALDKQMIVTYLKSGLTQNYNNHNKNERNEIHLQCEQFTKLVCQLKKN